MKYLLFPIRLIVGIFLYMIVAAIHFYVYVEYLLTGREIDQEICFAYEVIWIFIKHGTD